MCGIAGIFAYMSDAAPVDSEELLRQDIRFLGQLLGETLRQQEGEAALAIVERIRGQSVHSRREQAQSTGAELAALPEELATAFVLRELDQLSYTDIAHIMGTGEKTVSTRLHRARLRLRHRLAEWIREAPE